MHVCFWRWTDVPTGYIVRLHLVKLWRASVCLHWLVKPDPEPFNHDHPVSFLSLILWGSYLERRSGKLQMEYIWRRWWNYISASFDDRHTILEVKPHTLTLCLMWAPAGGRLWGYHLLSGWQSWKEYNSKKYKKKVIS